MHMRDRISMMMHWLSSWFKVNVNLFVGIDSKGAIKQFLMFGEDMEKITTLIKQEMLLIKSNIVDVGLFVFSIKDVRCNGVDNLITNKIILKFKFKW